MARLRQAALGAGTYRVWAIADAGGSGANGALVRARLYNATDTAVIEQGPNANLVGSAGNGHNCQVISQFTLAGSKAIELQVYPYLGTIAISAMSTGEVEVYANVFIEKVA